MEIRRVFVGNIACKRGGSSIRCWVETLFEKNWGKLSVSTEKNAIRPRIFKEREEQRYLKRAEPVLFFPRSLTEL